MQTLLQDLRYCCPPWLCRRTKGSKPTTSFAFASNKAPQKRSTMSPEGRARIAAAQKARWAKAKKK
jgi:hypothetical protein